VGPGCPAESVWGCVQPEADGCGEGLQDGGEVVAGADPGVQDGAVGRAERRGETGEVGWGTAGCSVGRPRRSALDPVRHDRRSRLPQRHADFHAAIWDSPEGRTAAARLQTLANRLVLATVRMAHQRGHLRGWNGDVGVDATSVPVVAHPDSRRRGSASVEITAGWHFKGGSGNPKHRPAPGQVTQTLLLAVMLTVANLTVLETWLTERAGPDELTDNDFKAAGPLPPNTAPAIAPSADLTGRHPPPRMT
jgi:hypothetical protein